METNERTAPEEQRRVGTFTLGVVLVVSGVLMLVSMGVGTEMLAPHLD